MKKNRMRILIMTIAIIAWLFPNDLFAQNCIQTSFTYDHADGFVDGLARVQRDGKWGFIDKSGKEVVPCVWDDIYYFINGLALVEKNGKYGFINKNNEAIVPIEYDSAIDFADGNGIAAVSKFTEEGELWAIIDDRGKFVTSFIYSDVARDVSGTHVYVDCEDENGMCSQESYMIDKYGNRIDEPSDDKDDLEIVKREGKYGVVNKNNDIIIPFNFDRITQRFGEYYIVEKREANELKGGGYLKGLFSNKGKQIIPCKYNEISDFHDGISMVYDGWSYGFISDRGEVISECIYSQAQPFSEGFAVVRDSKKMGYINTKGELIIPFQYETAESFHDGWANVENQYFIDKQGNKMMIYRTALPPATLSEWTSPTSQPEVINCSFRMFEKDGVYPVVPMVEIHKVSKKDFKSLIMYYKIVCDVDVSSNSSKYVDNENFKLCPSTKTGYDGKHRFAISGINDIDKIKNGVLIMEGYVNEYSDVRWDMVNSNNLGILVTEFDFYFKDGHHISLLPQGKKMLLPLSKEIEADEDDINGLNQYEGVFSMPGFASHGNENREGKAVYYYKNATDGTRLYEGVFKFSGNSGTEFMGKYKNNKQIGKWFWKQSGERFTINGNLSFNNEGIVNGDYDMTVKDNIARTDYRYSYEIHSTFRDGRLTYINEYDVTTGIRAIGKYSYYTSDPIGEWTLKGGDVPNGEAKIVFDTNGNCIEAFYFDKSTGDKYTLARWLREYPKSRYRDIVMSVRNRCFRDTKKPTY